MRTFSSITCLAAISLCASCGGDGTGAITPRQQWTAAQAAAWYDEQPWLVGSNFTPSTASNQLEMWQEATFDEDTIDRELGWAQALGFNTMRVFLHDLPWKDDRVAFLDRIDLFLDIAARHDIRVMLVFFDGVWDPFPKAGPQPDPRPHIHNSRWVQSPGADILGDPAKHDDLEPYVRAVVRRFRDDPRVLAWDLFNEPDNPNVISYADIELAPEIKEPNAEALLRKAFAWARAENPTQPITVGVWQGEWDDHDQLSTINRLMLTESDIITFHSYMPADAVEKLLAALRLYQRPVLCTEYMARAAGSRFETVLPVFKEQRVGAYNWGLVSGRTQTIYSWFSWLQMDRDGSEWFHDILHPDGSPYSADEVAIIRDLTAH